MSEKTGGTMKAQFWLSFTNDAPGFLGVAIVRADNIIEALAEATRLGINPGGQAAGLAWEEDEAAGGPIPEAYMNRLLTRAECEEFTKCFRHGDALDAGMELNRHVCAVNQEAE